MATGNICPVRPILSFVCVFFTGRIRHTRWPRDWSSDVSSSDLSGVATFSGLSIDKAGTGYTLVASSGGLTDPTSTAFNITAGSATQLVFTGQPSNTAAGAARSEERRVGAGGGEGKTGAGVTEKE